MDHLPQKDVMCHRTGFEKSCRTCVIEHNCRLWQHIQGTDPNTGQEINSWHCADEMRNKFIMDGAKEMRQAGASADKVASEIRDFHKSMAKQNLTMAKFLLSNGETPMSNVEVKKLDNKRED